MRIALRSFLAILVCLPSAIGQITLNSVPTRVIGQDSLTIKNINPNLVEGREFDAPRAVAIDTSTSPPALYVSDTVNNRVLGFRSATSFSNGQAADVVVGQLDFQTTIPAGPNASTTRSTGLDAPTGIAVDALGNLYVLDSGNNRILRFPQPFAQTGQPLPDMVIGQTAFTGGTSNQGGAASASTLSFAFTSGTTSTPLEAFITFDSAGDLWVADAGNNRVLRYNASVLGTQASSNPAADIVIGQSDFITTTYSPSSATNPLLSLSALLTPTGIAFDSAGRLFVEESASTQRGRILMYRPPFFIGQQASRILGVDLNTPQPPTVSEFQLNVSPGGIFAVGNSIGVADTFDNRILIFPPVEQWTPNTTFQAATTVIGQADFTSSTGNRALPTSGASTLSFPGGAVFYNNELYIADTGNNRVIVVPQSGSSFGPATRVLGQDAMNLNSVNLVEGREFNFTSQTGSVDAGMAVDLNSNPPRLYVADTYNHRVLGYRDLRNLQFGAKADIVIGQPDFQQTIPNYPNRSAVTSASSLFAPTGLIVDPDGNLYVADTGNSRVLRFPKPFDNYVPGSLEKADLVLGQSSFTATKITDPFPTTMSQPYGLALTINAGLAVSDLALNRVLYFKGKSSDFRSGMAATKVLGQQSFTTGGAGSGAAQLSSPHHISTDLEDRLYVADTGNVRVLIFDTLPATVSGEPAAQVITAGLTNPVGMYVSPFTNDIWVGDAGSSSTTGFAIRYPVYNLLVQSQLAPNFAVVDQLRPHAVVQDAYGDLFVADAGNRIIIFFPGLAPVNAATFLAQPLTPGMIASLFSLGNNNQFGGQPSTAGAIPLPTTLNGIQILFNGNPAPLFYADANQINFQVPTGAPTSGTSALQVLDVATGRILGDTLANMNVASPGIFTQTSNGQGTAIAVNKDGTINTQTNPAVAGDSITIYGTGQGPVPGGPPDGTAVSGPFPTTKPSVWIGDQFVPDSSVTYFGLAPNFVGLWQMNVLIPPEVITLPTNPVDVFIQEQSLISGVKAFGREVQIYVKQK
jgi:uncharacterized protein (TIGR03437 family)